MKISVYCKNIREKENLNILAFSKKIGCTRNYISKVESGEYDDPNPLVLSKIILKYDLDYESFLDDVEIESFTQNDYNELKRHLFRNRGTKKVFNKKGIAKKFRDEYLLPNGYRLLNKDDMHGDILINPATLDPVTYSVCDLNEFNIELAIKKERATIYPRLDFVCYKNDRLVFVKVISSVSTIAVKIDEEKILIEIERTMSDIAYNWFEVKDYHPEYDIIFLTPSEKIYDYLNSVRDSFPYLYNEFRIGVAFVRPKWPISGPIFWSDSQHKRDFQKLLNELEANNGIIEEQDSEEIL